MEEAEHCNPKLAALECDQIDHRRVCQPNGKLRDKLLKFERWRIDPLLIEFPADAREFRGGNAIVSQAFLTLTSDVHANANDFRQTSWNGLDSGNPNPEPDGDPIEASENDQQTGSQNSRPGEDYKVLLAETGGEEPPNKHEEQESGGQMRQQKLTLRESEFLLELSHPNVIKLEGFVEDLSKDVIWLVFPWEENGNLRDFLASGNWEIPERISLINDVAKGVEYLHSREPPICHGDLKSLNILVNSEYSAVITDFGSARRLADTEIDKQPSGNERKLRPTLDLASDENNPLQTLFCASTNTITLTSCKYTLRWAAPELLSEDQPSLGSDIWAFGWIAYEVMTNAIPFHDVKADTVVIKRVIQGDLPSVTDDARMSLIRALCSLMDQCWSISPNERPIAEECRMAISWMPMIVPASTHLAGSEASQERQAQLLVQLGSMYRRQSDYTDASNSYDKALNMFPANSESEGRADALLGLADVHYYRDELNEASTLYSQALQMYVTIGSEVGRAAALWGLGEIHRLSGDYDAAIPVYSESLQICTNTNDSQRRAFVLWGLAEVHQARSEYDEAITFFSQSLQIRTEIGDRQGRADTLWSLANIHRRRGEYADAIKNYSESLQLSIDLGDRYGEAYTLRDLAATHWSRNESSEAITLYSKSLQIYDYLGDKPKRAGVLYDLAEVHRSRDDYDDAATIYSEALQISTDLGDQLGRAKALLGMAEMHHRQSHQSDAISLYTEASGVFEQIGDSGRAADALAKAADARRELEVAA